MRLANGAKSMRQRFVFRRELFAGCGCVAEYVEGTDLAHDHHPRDREIGPRADVYLHGFISSTFRAEINFSTTMKITIPSLALPFLRGGKCALIFTRLKKAFRIAVKLTLEPRSVRLAHGDARFGDFNKRIEIGGFVFF